jgi:hypothetical protein
MAKARVTTGLHVFSCKYFLPEADRLKKMRLYWWFRSIKASWSFLKDFMNIRPKRKRGYYRALKRQEPWALREKMMKDCMNALNKTLYTDAIRYTMTGISETIQSK